MNINYDLDKVLEKVSLSFGVESLKFIIPKDFIVELNLCHIAAINVADLDAELSYNLKLYTLFSIIGSYMAEKLNKLDVLIKRKTAELSEKYEKDLSEKNAASKSTERITDKRIATLVLLDKGMQMLINSQAQIESYHSSFVAILKSLEKRHDNVIQLSTKRNAEIKAKVIST